LADFNTAVSLAPKSADAIYLRSVAYRKQGNKASADKDLATARQLNPKIEAEMTKRGIK
jgi:Flp pilus assembly protein TadD